MKEPTQKQRAILDFIERSIVARGFPPSFKEIGAQFGIRSTNAVNDHLEALERKGYLRRERYRSRSYAPTRTSRPDALAISMGVLALAREHGWDGSGDVVAWLRAQLEQARARRSA